MMMSKFLSLLCKGVNPCQERRRVWSGIPHSILVELGRSIFMTPKRTRLQRGLISAMICQYLPETNSFPNCKWLQLRKFWVVLHDRQLEIFKPMASNGILLMAFKEIRPSPGGWWFIWTRNHGRNYQPQLVTTVNIATPKMATLKGNTFSEPSFYSQ